MINDGDQIYYFLIGNSASGKEIDSFTAEKIVGNGAKNLVIGACKNKSLSDAEISERLDFYNNYLI